MKELKITRSTYKPLQPEWAPTLFRLKPAFDFYLEKLNPLLRESYSYGLSGMHGLDTHTTSVVFRGIDCALHLGCEPMPVVFACALHDAARKNDNFDTEHGKNAVPIAIKVMKQFPDLIDKETRLKILSAIMNHTDGKFAPDYISACLWDADRVRMAWQYGFDEKFFNTERGKYIAQHYQKYLDYQRHEFSNIKWSKQY